MQNEDKQRLQDLVFLDIAKLLAKFSKCRAFQMGALCVRNGKIITTGVNGSVPGTLNCNERFDEFDPATDIEMRKQHHEWSSNYEIHAEMSNIVMAAKSGISLDNATMYISNLPCANCLKHIAAVGIKRIVYEKLYDKGINLNDLAVQFFLRKTMIQLDRIIR